MSCARKTEEKKSAESEGGGRREQSSVQGLPWKDAALGSARGAGWKCLDELRHHQPYDGPYETSQMFFNGKTSDPGNIPGSLEERDELANGRLQR